MCVKFKRVMHDPFSSQHAGDGGDGVKCAVEQVPVKEVPYCSHHVLVIDVVSWREAE